MQQHLHDTATRVSLNLLRLLVLTLICLTSTDQILSHWGVFGSCFSQTNRALTLLLDGSWWQA